MSSQLDYFEGILYLLLVVGSLLVNIPLIVFLWQNLSSREDVVSTVMVSLTVSDLLHGTVAPGLGTANAILTPQRVPYPLIVFQGSARHILMFSSVWHLALMSALKCYIIARPLTYSAVLTAGRRNALVAAIWTAVVVTIVGADLVGVRWTVDPLTNLVAPTGNPTMTIGFRNFESGFMIGVPSVVIFVAYAKIFFVVRHHQVTIASLAVVVSTDAGGRPSATTGGHAGWSVSVRSARSLFVICIAFYVTYLPSSITNVGLTLPVWYLVGARLLLLNGSILNSLLYILLYKSTRKNFRRMFFGRCSQVAAVADAGNVPTSVFENRVAVVERF